MEYDGNIYILKENEKNIKSNNKINEKRTIGRWKRKFIESKFEEWKIHITNVFLL